MAERFLVQHKAERVGERVVQAFGIWISQATAEGSQEPSISQVEEITDLLASQLLLRKVRVNELETEPHSRPITRYSIANTEAILPPIQEYIEANGRQYKGSGWWGPMWTYTPNDWRSHRRRTIGKVVGFDPLDARVIIKPRGIMGIGDRDWVRLTDETGQPLVKLEVYE